MMATLEYEGENYVVAKAYYDSASTSFPTNDARRGTAALYALNLLDVAKNISIINLQDSLLRISGMTDKEKREVAARAKKALPSPRPRRLHERAAANQSVAQRNVKADLAVEGDQSNASRNWHWYGE